MDDADEGGGSGEGMDVARWVVERLHVCVCVCVYDLWSQYIHTV